MIKALMVDVDGVLVCGRPSDGRNWATELEADLGLHATDLHKEFFAPHWNYIVVGRAGLQERLAPVLAKVAPHLSCDDLISYWFTQDSRLNARLLETLARYRAAGLRLYLATNQEHLRAKHLMDSLGLSAHVDGIYYSAAMGCQKPDATFFEGATAHSGFALDEILLIDDSTANIVAAQAFGWRAVHWTGEDSNWNTLSEALALE